MYGSRVSPKPPARTRPAKGELNVEVTLSFMTTTDQAEWLRSEAARRGVSLAQVIRDAITKAKEHHG